MSKQQTHAFQTEISQLLDLMINSLYSQKEIFLRELISNSSDAIDKRRFEALTDASLLNDDEELAVTITTDSNAKTLTISDNGIGMSYDEVIENIGTIARSGTKKFVEAVKNSGKEDADVSLIGQFGVGFYSVFMVADKVTLTTRKAGTSEGTQWESDGKGEFTIETIEKDRVGTDITLHLREEESEYLEDFRLKHIIRTYSEHISLPIKMLAPAPLDEDGKPQEDVEREFETVNSGTAIWARPKSEISDQEYQNFYQSLSYDMEPPLSTLHHKVEGNMEYTSLLFIPKKAPFDLWNRDNKKGIKLYVRRVFIMDDAEHLLPHYLRFVKGVIDSQDLPLNVSREILQSDRDIKKIKASSIKRVLDELTRLAKNESEQYQEFWSEFGQVLKEGVVEDMANKDKITPLLRFATTQSDSAAQTVSLDDYIGRMQEGQEAIYYITAESHQAAKGSPHLEVFAKKGIEVLLLCDPVDEWLVNSLGTYNDKPLKSVTKGDLSLSDEEKKAQEEQKEELSSLTEKLQDVLSEAVKEVRLTYRLTESPACLVADENDPGANMERIMKAMGQDAPSTKPILEINPEHALIKKLDTNSDSFADWAQVLFDQAALSEGAQIKDPANYVKLVNRLLVA
ncbi:chaperone protein HtpG [Arenicella chitinivorans]|uniref:Chaperone protein HtpG n=1 Tax=Arenicella chitinivorans TaxID=1329800 RepID=A0A918RH65_9GAMM|nr:molecular chaperone HtpG [Arenicella chitinivorans]GGZ99914.1 chaperone protein HtpG [Arenicella chitinivorans]